MKQVIYLVVLTWVMLAITSITSRAQAPLKIHIISGSNEYRSEVSLKTFKQYLENHYTVEITASWVEDKAQKLPGVEYIPDADLLVVFSRRLKLPEHQIEVVKQHWEQGKPVIGIRTASHAFDDQTNQIFDHKVLGGDYQGHLDDRPVAVKNIKPGHPVLQGVESFTSRKLYKAGTLADDAVVLQTGIVEGASSQPVSWVHTYNGGRIFYTSLGVPGDFKDPNFRRMLINAIFWTASREPE